MSTTEGPDILTRMEQRKDPVRRLRRAIVWRLWVSGRWSMRLYSHHQCRRALSIASALGFDAYSDKTIIHR